jgi:hypothetical protein
MVIEEEEDEDAVPTDSPEGENRVTEKLEASDVPRRNGNNNILFLVVSRTEQKNRISPFLP